MDGGCELLCLDLRVAERLRRERLPASVAEASAARSRPLGDATRLTLLAALAEAGALCVCDLAWIVERAQNLVSHHMRVLRTAGLVASRREGKMVIYELTEHGLELLELVLDETEVRA